MGEEGIHVENFLICIWRARGPARGPETPACTMEGGKYVEASRNRRRYAWGSLLGSEDTTSKRALTAAVSGVGEGSESTKL